MPVVFSQGDPRGVGPELLLHAAAQGDLRPGDVVFAARDTMDAVAAAVSAPWAAPGRSALEAHLHGPGTMSVVESLERAVTYVLDHPEFALVTPPIDKAECRRLGFAFPGHTEYLAARAETEDFGMFMVGDRIRVALATIHVPLAQVATVLSVERIVRAGRLAADTLQRLLGVKRPKIAVLGLNPHAGERGLLGDEERTVVEPALASLRSLHTEVDFSGPHPADSAFFHHRRGDYDAIVAMYHDQGLGPFKLEHFSDGVNVTMGLPFWRTSPDHGTAYDIARTGTVDPSSFRAAIRLARQGLLK